MEENGHTPSAAERLLILMLTVGAGLLIVGGLICGMISVFYEIVGSTIETFA